MNFSTVLRRRFIIIPLLAVVIVSGIYFLKSRESTMTFSMPVNKRIIVIDPGHGGWDPGKIAGNIEEKDINLQIAEKLQMLFEQGGAIVFMTRTDDSALGAKKMEDLAKRTEIANVTNADLLLSIHQNSFEQESVRGAQVFYYEKSEKGKELAQVLQDKMRVALDNHNSRPAKGNPDYYVLKNSAPTAVIIECGFLSNSADVNLLLDDNYQEKVAWAIYMGIVEYFAAGN